MKKVWEITGRIVFWLSWPLLFLFLLPSKRTRILVMSGDDVLVVRGWLASKGWGLPGGGLHRGEDPAEGATRELKEETGIEVNATDLQFIFSGQTKSRHGFRFKVFAYALKLGTKPKLTKQRLEITHLQWINWRELLRNPKTDPDTQEMLSAMYDGLV